MWGDRGLVRVKENDLQTLQKLYHCLQGHVLLLAHSFIHAMFNFVLSAQSGTLLLESALDFSPTVCSEWELPSS